MSVSVHAQLLQSCPTLCNPMDCSPPGTAIRVILQARLLEWEAIPSSRRSSRPRDRARVSYISCIGSWALYHSHHHLGSSNLNLISQFEFLLQMKIPTLTLKKTLELMLISANF